MLGLKWKVNISGPNFFDTGKIPGQKYPRDRRTCIRGGMNVTEVILRYFFLRTVVYGVLWYLLASITLLSSIHRYLKYILNTEDLQYGRKLYGRNMVKSH